MTTVSAPVLCPDYDSYLRFEWDKFMNEPERSRASLELSADISIKRVLDVGCGAGFYLAQEYDSAQAYLARSRDGADRIGDQRTAGNAGGTLASIASCSRLSSPRFTGHQNCISCLR